MDDRILSEEEFADLVGYKVSYVQKLRYQKQGPSYHQPQGKGGKVFYLLSEVHAWLRNETNDESE